jgi:DNA-binding LacI/PurR family transcriptional regulator
MKQRTKRSFIEKYLKYRPTAILTINNQLAHHCILALKKYGLNIPDDISVATFDTDTLKTLTYFKVTGIKQNFTEIGHAAVELLLRRILTENGNIKNTGTVKLIEADFIKGTSVKNLTV